MIPGNFLRDNSFMRLNKMKPQCETTADCLRELARVMDQFEIKNITVAIHSEYIRCCAWFDPKNLFISPSHWSFAIAEVEGKAVFIGDVLYFGESKFKVMSIVGSGILVKFTTGLERIFLASDFSWNPPKPKTVMVELSIDDAKFLTHARTYYAIDDHLAAACKKALENLK